MDNGLKISLAVTGVGLASSIYVNKNSNDESIRKYKSTTGLLFLGGALSSLYFGVLKDHPKRQAMAIIPVGLLATYGANFSFDSAAPKNFATNSITSLGLGSSIGALTYLLTGGNIKTSLIVGGIASAAIFASRYNTNINEPKQAPAIAGGSAI